MANIKIDKAIVKVNVQKVSNEVEEVVLTDVKIPTDAPARMKVLRAEKKKWYLTVVYLPNSEKPFALFCTTNHSEGSVQTHNAVDSLTDLARKKGILSEHIDKLLLKISHTSNVEKLTRTISLLLRHNVSIASIVSVLDNLEGIIVGSFLFQIKKFLSQYIKNGQKAEGKKCDNCGSTKIIYSEGCFICADCGSSKC